jgi:Matrixin
MARLLTTLTLAVALLFPAAAGAAVAGAHQSHAHAATHARLSVRRASLEKLARRGPVALATAVAELYWHAVPCRGQIRVLGNLPVPSSLEYGTDAWVTFNSSLGQNNLEAPAATYTQCTISLAAWQWPTQRAMESDWNMFCLTVTHEVGHLLGYKHTLSPGAVMAPVFTNESNVPAICRATRRLGTILAGRTPTR